MSVSTTVQLFRKNTDPAHQAKLAACHALVEAKVSELPLELQAYFGVKTPLAALEESEEPAARCNLIYPVDHEPEWLTRPEDRDQHVIEIDLDKLPPDLRIIRVVCG